MSFDLLGTTTATDFVAHVDTVPEQTSTDIPSDVPAHEAEPIQISADPSPEPTTPNLVTQAESDSDDEDWDDISKGRYFGTGDGTDDGPLCHNCKQSGHKKKDCPHQLCRSCGALDDHDTMRCPMTQRCYNCSRLGHVASKCPEPHRQVGSFCRECGSKSHLERSCPQIWRLYLPATGFNNDGEWDVEAWCYNCAGKGHYGDDCPKPHRARLIEQSAFCQANQPESRRERLQREASERRESSRHQRLDEEEREDDWFARQNAPGGYGSYRPSPNHNSFQNGNAPYTYPALPPPPLPQTTRRSRQADRYDPYARPSGPIITSERFPRGMSGRGAGGAQASNAASRGGSKRGSQKRIPVPAAQRFANQQSQAQAHGRPSNTRGGKAYRGGGRR